MYFRFFIILLFANVVFANNIKQENKNAKNENTTKDQDLIDYIKFREKIDTTEPKILDEEYFLQGIESKIQSKVESKDNKKYSKSKNNDINAQEKNIKENSENISDFDDFSILINLKDSKKPKKDYKDAKNKKQDSQDLKNKKNADTAQDIESTNKDSKNKDKNDNNIESKIDTGFNKSQIFLSAQTGLTFLTTKQSYILPTLNLKIGYQNFLGVYKNNFGINIYADMLVASNGAQAFFTNELKNIFIATNLGIFNINTDIMYEFNINSFMRFALGAGGGFGFLNYSDPYYDSLQGLSSNITLQTYLLFKKTHKLSFSTRFFFYSPGSYVTRKVGFADLQSSHFVRPYSLLIGYSYVF